MRSACVDADSCPARPEFSTTKVLLLLHACRCLQCVLCVVGTCCLNFAMADVEWYSQAGLSDEAQGELDFLSATFPELQWCSDSNTARLSVPAREGVSGAAAAVAADLELRVPEAYPSEPVQVAVPRGRGGLDAAALSKQLHTIAQAAADACEPCLFQIVEDARDAMGELVKQGGV